MDHYEEFGVASTATTDEIRLAHKSLARLLHPDRIQDANLRRLAECQMKRVNSIYEVLADPVRRRIYDAQFKIVAPLELAVVPESPWRLWLRKNGMWLLATLGAMLGIHSCLVSMGGERVRFIERPPQAAEPAREQVRSAQPRQPEEFRQLLKESHELRKALDRALAERDQALTRLAALQTAANAAPAFSPPAHISSTAGATPPMPAPHPYATPQPRPPPRSGLAGTWIYTPTTKPSPNDLYPADYIELVVVEQEDLVWGRYRGRYRVPDRALSPEVEFQFQGTRANANRLVWLGNGGAKGEVHLKMISENALGVDWFTSQFGKALTLSSGTAVLTRKAEP